MTVVARPVRARRLPLHVIGLLALYAGVAALAIWQGTRHLSPTIFTDELELTQLARSIASTGEATLRGQPEGIAPLAAYLTAPVWWIDDVPTAYSVAKTLGALLMAAAVFPAYALARLVVRPAWALFAAAGTGFAPALAYAPILVTEPTAYPASTLALFLIARWATKPRKLGFLLAAGGCTLAFLTRTQLSVLFAVLVLVALAVAWRTPRATGWRSRWTLADWAGGIVLLTGLAIAVGSILAHGSESWYRTTTFYKDRMLEYGLWAAGAMTIGLGVVPVVAGLAAVARPLDEKPRPGTRALAILTIASVACFGMYTAVKAAYLSTEFAVLTLERNLIYLVPVLFAGTALLLQRRRGHAWAILAAGGFALYLVTSTPYALATYPYYEAHGLSIAALANRIFHWPDETIERALIAVTVVSTVLMLLLVGLRARALAAGAIVAVLACGTLVWTGTTEIYAANGESRFAKRLHDTLPKPANWLDKQTGGRSVVFLGQGIVDPNPVQLLEFWNRSLTKVWALDGSAPGPGATTKPNLDRPDGTLTPPHTSYALVTPGVDLAGQLQGPSVGGYRLYPLDPLAGGKLRLRSAQSGIYPDGWMGAESTYAWYDVPAGERGVLHVGLSRASWCGEEVRSTVRVRIGRVATSDGEPVLGKVTAEESGILHSCQILPDIVLPTPPGPWLAQVDIDPTFSPKQLDPSDPDPRQLGATVSFRYERGT